MTYQISYEMARELIRHLYDKTYGLRKIKETDPDIIQQLFNLHLEVQDLLAQLEKDNHDVSQLKQEIQEHIRQKYDYKQLLIKVDGGVRGINDKAIRSRAACGFQIYGDNELLVSNSYYLGDKIRLPRLPEEEGEAPNFDISPNIAEYMAVIKALDYLITFDPKVESIVVQSDSEVIVNQINMLTATRVDNLLRLRHAAHERMKKLGYVQLQKIPREQNLDVDALVNQCLDKAEAKEREEADETHS